jgi:hypothetical protein
VRRAAVVAIACGFLAVSTGADAAAPCSVSRDPTPNIGVAPSDLNHLNAVSLSSPISGWSAGGGEVFLDDRFGFRPLLARWNGSAWTGVPSPQPPVRDALLLGVDAASATEAWAVGAEGNFIDSSGEALVEHWDGSRWLRVPSPMFPVEEGAQLRTVVEIAPDDAWSGGALGAAGATSTLVEHWNGDSWTRVPDRVGPGVVFSMAAQGSDVWASGYRFDRVTGAAHTLIERWNGRVWRVLRTPDVVSTEDPGEDFNVVTSIVPDHGGAWAVGFGGNPDLGIAYTPSVLRFDGHRWRSATQPATGSGDAFLWSAALDARGKLLIAGSRVLRDGISTRTVLVRRIAGSWRSFPSLSGELRGLDAASDALLGVGWTEQSGFTSTLGVHVRC